MVVLWRELAFLLRDYFPPAPEAAKNAGVVWNVARLIYLIERSVGAERNPIRILVESHGLLAFNGEVGLDHGVDSRFYRDVRA
jgi:hypothetical protein